MRPLTDQLIVGDCIEQMRLLPDDSVDVTFADPPFNLGKRYASYSDGQGAADYLNWCYEWLSEMVRITKPTGSILVHNIPKWLTYFSAHLNSIAHFKHWIAWHAMSTPLGNTLFPTHYGILFYTKSPKGFKFYEIRAPHPRCRKCGEFHKDYGGKSDQRHPFGPLIGDVWTDIHRIRHNKRRDPHPCQLPIHLMERLILMTTDPGDVILDPFVGTGTTAIAARSLRRYCIGIDKDPNYIDIAAKKRDASEIKRYGRHYVSRHLDSVVTMRDIDAKSAFPPQYTSIDKKRDRVAAMEVAAVLMDKPLEDDFGTSENGSNSLAAKT